MLINIFLFEKTKPTALQSRADRIVNREKRRVKKNKNGRKNEKRNMIVYYIGTL